MTTISIKDSQNILHNYECVDLLTSSGNEAKENGPNKLMPLLSQSNLL
jgi:hypothetical protein